MSKVITTTKTRDKVLTRKRLAQALKVVQLSPEEEIVVRLRYGIGLSPEEKLSFRGGASEELKVHLAMVEKSILDVLEEEAKSTSGNKLEPFKEL